jgi:hypothetical protein
MFDGLLQQTIERTLCEAAMQMRILCATCCDVMQQLHEIDAALSYVKEHATELNYNARHAAADLHRMKASCFFQQVFILSTNNTKALRFPQCMI